MEYKLDDAKACGRCRENKALEIQARSILNGDVLVCNGHKHCPCKPGHHAGDGSGCQAAAKENDSGDFIGLDGFRSSSKKIRRGANGRFVQASDLPGLKKLESQVDHSLIPGLGDDEARLCLARLPRSSYGMYYTVSKRFCSLLRSGELYKTRRGLGISEQWVYLLNSGQSVWRAFSPVDGGRWRPLPPTPADTCFDMCDKESLTAGTQLLVVGRELSGHVIWGYDLVTDKWFRAPQMITRRFLYGSASFGVHAFVAGGIDSNQAELSAAERYDSSTGKWEALPDMNKKRKMCSGFYMSGKFYVIGGVNSSEGDLTCGEEYDPDSRTWRTIPNMYPANGAADHAPPLVAVVDNQLYSLDTSSRQLKMYCKGWKVIGDVPVKADSSSGWGVAFKALDGELLLIGGEKRDGDAIYAWKPSYPGPVQWRFVAGLVPQGTFVFNCAVMSA